MIPYHHLKSTNRFNFVILALNLFPFLYVWEALRDEKAIFGIRQWIDIDLTVSCPFPYL